VSQITEREEREKDVRVLENKRWKEREEGL
jgi:hypothetical protein